MTTKPKTRKVPAAKTVTPKAAPKEETGEPKQEISEIRRLVARWRWLEADQTYQSARAETEEESDRLIGIHNDEEKKIERQLATLVPESFLEACSLLDFATDIVAERVPDQCDIDMLRNARTGLLAARRNDMKAERKATVEKMRHSIHMLADIAGSHIN